MMEDDMKFFALRHDSRELLRNYLRDYFTIYARILSIYTYC
jgi:hypothetical protein